jgi:tetratricopeptide (TPR) repeat protein
MNGDDSDNPPGLVSVDSGSGGSESDEAPGLESDCESGDGGEEVASPSGAGTGTESERCECPDCQRARGPQLLGPFAQPDDAFAESFAHFMREALSNCFASSDCDTPPAPARAPETSRPRATKRNSGRKAVKTTPKVVENVKLPPPPRSSSAISPEHAKPARPTRRMVWDGADPIEAMELALEKARRAKLNAAEAEVTVEAQLLRAIEMIKSLVPITAPCLPLAAAMAKAEEIKKAANAHFQNNFFAEAVESYTHAIAYMVHHVPEGVQAPDPDAVERGEVESEDPGMAAAMDLKVSLLCNRSLAHLKWSNVGLAKADGEAAVRLNPLHTKGYYRRAMAEKEGGAFREAILSFRMILRLDPDGQDASAVTKHLRECEKLERQSGFSKAIKAEEEKKAAARSKGKAVSAPDAQSQARAQHNDGTTTAITAVRSFPPIAPANKFRDVKTPVLLPPGAPIQRLAYLSAQAVAAGIGTNPAKYIKPVSELLSEYIALIGEKMDFVALETFLQSEECDFTSLFNPVNKTYTHWSHKTKLWRGWYATISHAAFLSAQDGEDAPAGEAPVPRAILDPFLGLVDVFAAQHILTYKAETQSEAAIPKLFDFSPPRTSGSAVVGRQDFLKQLNVFSEGQLQYVDWNNVVLAGGAVLAALTPMPPTPLREFFHTNHAYKSSDIDLFLYGLNTDAATKKVSQLYHAVKKANPQVFCVRSLHTITLVSEFPKRKIQIILRLYKTLAEVLHGFDLDACSVGFDGTDVWATDRAARAITRQYNMVDLSYLSPSYESRLFKYSKRGYRVAVPGFKPDRVKKSITDPMGGRWPSVSGLAKLVVLDRWYV